VLRYRAWATNVLLLERSAMVGRRHGDALFDDLGHFLAGRDQLEYAPVDFPVAELLGPEGVMTQVGDVEAVGEVVEHDAAFTAEDAHRPRLIQCMNVVPAHMLAPVPGSRLEA
jgi:hypothetical protein